MYYITMNTKLGRHGVSHNNTFYNVKLIGNENRENHQMDGISNTPQKSQKAHQTKYRVIIFPLINTKQYINAIAR